MFEHFDRNEFSCKCGCGFDTVDVETLWVLEELRRWFGKPVHINSGCRCVNHNIVVGGSKNSKHLEGRAVDIYIDEVAPEAVYEYLDKLYPDRYGVGKYKTFTHLDTRRERARW